MKVTNVSLFKNNDQLRKIRDNALSLTCIYGKARLVIHIHIQLVI